MFQMPNKFDICYRTLQLLAWYKQKCYNFFSIFFIHFSLSSHLVSHFLLSLLASLLAFLTFFLSFSATTPTSTSSTLTFKFRFFWGSHLYLSLLSSSPTSSPWCPWIHCHKQGTNNPWHKNSSYLVFFFFF